MPTEPIIGTGAVVQVAPIVNGVVQEYVTLKNSEYTIKPKITIKTAPNTSDGMLRAAGLKDYELKVKGHTDASDGGAVNAIETDVMPGTILEFKAYRNYVSAESPGVFWGGRVIVGEDLSIETGVENTEDWEFTAMRQSGPLTKPDGTTW